MLTHPLRFVNSEFGGIKAFSHLPEGSAYPLPIGSVGFQKVLIMEHYYAANRHYREKFGTKVYKLALDGGFTCPTRDGTLDTRGCIFCSGAGSGDFAVSACGGTAAAIERAKAAVAAKNKGGRYIAYFQSYTGTYAPVSRLRALFLPAVLHPEVVALSVATRPDCLGPEVLALLEELNRIKPVYVELGLQTIQPQTAAYIRRGYPLSDYDAAVRALRGAGIEVIAHMILCLPGESPADMAATAAYIGRSGATGIKFQLLHVLRGTDLAADYLSGAFTLPTLEEYTPLLEQCIRVIPPDLVVHRLTGDGPKRDLIAPLWTGDKKHVLNTIRAAFDRDGLVQGSAYVRD